MIEAISCGESDLIANLSNTSAVIKLAYENTNWVGFYIYKENVNDKTKTFVLKSIGLV